MNTVEILKMAIADGVRLETVDGRIKMLPTTKALSKEFKDGVAANKPEIMVAVSGERHWTNPQTGKAFVTRLKKCERCRFSLWGEVGNQDQWGCLLCRVSG
jgi:hypothetical protein